jgi:hypothetical protein
MAVFACTSCGWVRRSPAAVAEAKCPICGEPACSLTPHGRLDHDHANGRARAAAATARALHDPTVAPLPPHAA